MSKSAKIFWWIVAIIIIVWVAMSFTKKSEAPMVANNEPIKIGFIGALTGDAASMGNSALKAVQFAVKEVNDAGGINGRQVTLIAEDGACNAASASSAGNKLINVDKVVAIIGGLCSGETSAFGPVAMQNKVITFSYLSSSPSLSSLGKYFFRDYPSDAFQGKFAADYVYNKLGLKKVAIIYANTDWGKGISDVFASRFKELGGTVVTNEGVTQDSRDYRTEIGKAKAAGAQLIYAPTYNEGGAILLKQVADAKINIPVYGGDAWADSKLWSQVDGKLGAFYSEVKTNESKDFSDKFTTAYPGEKTGLGTAQAYDAASIVLNSIKKVGTEDPDALSDAIRATDIQGVSGRIVFDKNGDITEANYIIKKLLGNGKTEEVK